MKVDQCISEICICGRHRCPKKPRKNIRPITSCDTKLPNSEYTEKYRKFNVPPRSAIKPAITAKKCDAKMETLTTNAEAYRAHKCEPVRQRPATSYHPPTVKMFDESTYLKDYCDFKIIAVPNSCKPKSKYKPPSVPLDDLTLHKQSFRTWDENTARGCRGVLQKPVHQSLPANRPFQALTTCQDDYREYRGIVPVKGKGRQSTLCTEGIYFMDTTHKMDFTRKPICFRKLCKPQIVRPELPPLKDSTLYQRDYRPPPKIVQRKDFRPVVRYNPPDNPLESDTFHKTDYKPWKVQEREIPPWTIKKPYEMPSIKMHDVTTYVYSYRKHPHFRQLPSRKPVQALKFGDGKVMESETCHSHDFRKWEVGPRRPIVKLDAYRLPEGKMLTESTYTSQFRGQFVPPSTTMKPKPLLKINVGPMQDTSVYQEEFRCPASGVCPASLLNSTSPEGKPLYLHTGSSMSHEYYMKLNGGRT
ncbi:stabilizer of axonemal microtubules 2 [Centruroides vittatus]|uniref:stabilizer of axonemal microtubules 2 n=1 Tax=Centruroides vittatus TaxID=120091 RepID=UPI00351012A5